MDITLDDAQQAELARVKALGKEIQKQVYESLSVQNVGGYHIGNLARQMNAAMQSVLPDEVVTPEVKDPTIDDVIQPNE